MQRLHLCWLLTLLACAHVQTASDEAAVRALPVTFVDAFSRHDARALAEIMTDDVDFVTVGAVWLHGKKDFEAYHARLLSGRFRGVRMTLLATEVRFLRPDLAVVHWSWRIEGDRNPDGSAREPRVGIMIMVARKKGSVWFNAISQNTNASPERPPELEDIRPPIPIPWSNDSH